MLTTTMLVAMAAERAERPQLWANNVARLLGTIKTSPPKQVSERAKVP